MAQSSRFCLAVPGRSCSKVDCPAAAAGFHCHGLVVEIVYVYVGSGSDIQHQGWTGRVTNEEFGPKVVNTSER